MTEPRGSSPTEKTPFERSPDPIVTFDDRLACLRANAEARKMFTRGSAMFDGLELLQLFVENDRAHVGAALEELRRGGRCRFEADAETPTGPLPVEVVAVLDADGGQAHLRDVTERRRVDQLKDDFISVVNHELRTPLTSISGALGLILGGVGGEVSGKVRALAETAHTNCQRLGRLINDMLDVQKIESGNVEFSPQHVEMVALVRQAIEANDGYARRFGVTVRFDPSVTVAEVRVDPDRVLQVIANLLSNAAKYSPTGGVVTVSVERGDAGIRVSVRDRGKGIPEYFRSRVFSKFAQADTSTTRKKGGTGLGLAISRAIVEGMGGRIGFDQPDDGGTRFWFEFPDAARPDDAALGYDVSVGLDSVKADVRCATPADIVAAVRGLAPRRFFAAVGCVAETARVVRADRRLDRAVVFACGADGTPSYELALWSAGELEQHAVAAAVRVVGAQRERRVRVQLVDVSEAVAGVTAALLAPIADTRWEGPASPDLVVWAGAPSEAGLGSVKAFAAAGAALAVFGGPASAYDPRDLV